MSLYRTPRDSISPSAKPQRHTSRSAARLAAAWAQHPFIIISSAGTKAGSRVLLSDHLFYLWWPCQDHQIILDHGYLYHVRNAWWVHSITPPLWGVSTPGVSVRVRIHTDTLQDARELMIGRLSRVHLHAAGLWECQGLLLQLWVVYFVYYCGVHRCVYLEWAGWLRFWQVNIGMVTVWLDGEFRFLLLDNEMVFS